MTISEQLEQHKGLMTLPAFAEFMGVSYDTVQRWMRTAELPAQKIRGTYWIDPQLAARWWREHEYAPKLPQRQRAQKAAAHVA